MESIYKLEGRARDIAYRYEELQMAFEEAMEENGGELTEETGQMLEEMEELKAMEAQLREDFLKFPDAYAAWYKNVDAKKKAIQAEKAAMEKQFKEALAKYDTRIREQERTQQWITCNMEQAMLDAQVDKFDKKSRPDAMFSIYFSKSNSIEVNEEMAIEPFVEILRKANESCPEWLTFEPKISKKVLQKAEDLPQGFARRSSKTLIIK